MILIGIFLCINKTYAAEKAIDNETESKIIEIKEKIEEVELVKKEQGTETFSFEDMFKDGE